MKALPYGGAFFYLRMSQGFTIFVLREIGN